MANLMKSYKLSLLTAIVILAGLLAPVGGLPSTGISFIQMDKIVHFGIFFVLGIIICFEYYQKNYRLHEIKLLIILIAFAFLTEILQYLTGYRQFDIKDIMADSLGGIVAIFYFSKWGKHQASRFLLKFNRKNKT